MPIVGQVSSGPKEPLPWRAYLGLDPGSVGGMAILDRSGSVLELRKMPESEEDLWAWLTRVADEHGRQNLTALLERVGGYVPGNTGNGMVGQPGSAMFNFGWNYGNLRMALVAAGIDDRGTVEPVQWQRAAGIDKRRKGESKTEFKNRIRDAAEEQFPGVQMTMATCDALLIAEYARRRDEGWAG